MYVYVYMYRYHIDICIYMISISNPLFEEHWSTENIYQNLYPLIHLSVEQTWWTLFSCVDWHQISELEAQCKEASVEEERNVQLTTKVQELEAELQDKEQVRGNVRPHGGPSPNP